MLKYFYTANKDNFQQIDDNYSAYALDKCENITDYFCGITSTHCSYTYTPLVLDGDVLCNDTSARNQRVVYWLCYIIPKCNDEVIYIYNPSPSTPVYLLKGAAIGDIVYGFGCRVPTQTDANGIPIAWKAADYKIKNKIVDTSAKNNAAADVIYLFGGFKTFYKDWPTIKQIISITAETKKIADNLKIMRFRPIREIAEKISPFGLAVYASNGELSYTVDSNGKNYQMANYYKNTTFICGEYETGCTPDIGNYTSENFNNLAVMPIGHPCVVEGFAPKGHAGGMDPAQAYPIKLTKNQWSISQLSGCGVDVPTGVDGEHPDSKYPTKSYDQRIQVGNRYYYYQDIIEGAICENTIGYLELLTMDCSRYL